MTIDQIESMKTQLLIVMVRRLKGIAKISAAEIEAASKFVLMMRTDPKTEDFVFEVVEKGQGRLL